jgi:hypothetical protein
LFSSQYMLIAPTSGCLGDRLFFVIIHHRIHYSFIVLAPEFSVSALASGKFFLSVFLGILIGSISKDSDRLADVTRQISCELTGLRFSTGCRRKNNIRAFGQVPRHGRIEFFVLSRVKVVTTRQTHNIIDHCHTNSLILLPSSQ